MQRPEFKQFACRLLTALILLVCPLSQAGEGRSTRFAIVYNTQHETFAQTVLKQLQNENPRLPLQLIGGEHLSAIPPDTIIITLGKAHFQQILDSGHYRSQRIISSFISSHDYYAIAGYPPRQRNTGALFSDPPLTRQIDLVSELLQPVSISIVYDSNSTYIRDELIRYQREGTRINLVEYRHKNINQLLADPAITESDFLLASYNPAIYNGENIKNIIFTLLRRKQGLIGYSSSWVDSGALATTYSDQAAIIKSLARYLETVIRKNGRLPGEQHPAYFSININNDIAKALSITSVPKADLINAIKNREDN